MRLPVVDCRDLIEFCRAFERHHHNNNFASSDPNLSGRARRSTSNSLNPFSDQFCHRSPWAVLDLVILISVLGSLGFLIVPYLRFFFFEALPLLHGLVVELILDAPLAYFMGLVLALLGVILTFIVWEIVDMRLRRCGNPHCKGLRRSVAYDIQLETEECVKYFPQPSDACNDDKSAKELELGQDQKELEAELKKMAPLNGRTVLIFRAPCGCPAGRLEVWGPKKVRRIKK